MTFYSPQALAFLLTIPAIIILYLLKQRYQEHTVSSLYLWHEVLKDIEASAPWQKLKKNILMILQIAAMSLLVFALSNPYINNAVGTPGTVVIIIDTSLSMQAVDIKPSRFEAARSKASSYVANLQPESRVTLISMGSHAVIEENLSTDKKRLLKSIGDLKVTNSVDNTEDAKELARSIVKQYPDAKVVVFSDKEFSIPGTDTDFFKLSGNGWNYAVMLVSHMIFLKRKEKLNSWR